MTLSVEQYQARAMLEAAYKVQNAKTPADADSLRGCLMMAVQMAHALKLNRDDLTRVLTEEAGLWEEYLVVKQRLITKRKEKKP